MIGLYLYPKKWYFKVYFPKEILSGSAAIQKLLISESIFALPVNWPGYRTASMLHLCSANVLESFIQTIVL